MNEQDFRGCSRDINQCSLIGNQQVTTKYLKPKHFRLISFEDLKNQSFKLFYFVSLFILIYLAIRSTLYQKRAEVEDEICDYLSPWL